MKWKTRLKRLSVPLAESFYNTKNGSSIITSKSLSRNLGNENKHTLCFQRIGILIHFLSWRQQKHQCSFRYWDSFWCNNWPFVFDVVKRLCYEPRNEWKILQIDNNFLSLNFHTSFTQQDNKIIVLHVKMTTKLRGKEAALNCAQP